jgi:hypothetical protein
VRTKIILFPVFLFLVISAIAYFRLKINTEEKVTPMVVSEKVMAKPTSPVEIENTDENIAGNHQVVERPTESVEIVEEESQNVALAPEKVKEKKLSIKSAMYEFKNSCLIKRTPSETSETVGKVSRGKTLWVQNHNNNWATVYMRSGEAYVPKTCLQAAL